jgi:hypothetical protein
MYIMYMMMEYAVAEVEAIAVFHQHMIRIDRPAPDIAFLGLPNSRPSGPAPCSWGNVGCSYHAPRAARLMGSPGQRCAAPASGPYYHAHALVG